MGIRYYNTKSIFWLRVYNNNVLLLSRYSILSRPVAYNHFPHLYDYKKIEKYYS